MNKGYKWTVNACFTGYIVQAIVNNFVPLLFLTFQSSYGIPLSRITLLITVNFAVQLTVDLVSVTFVDRIGYRVSMLIAHGMAALGLAGLTILPRMLGNAYAGLLISVVCYAVGGGLLEVLVSPVISVRGHHVAGNLQQGHCFHQKRRHRAVCAAGSGRGYRLFGRTHTGGLCVGGIWRRPAQGDSGRDSVPGAVTGRIVFTAEQRISIHGLGTFRIYIYQYRREVLIYGELFDEYL